jgi:hypothetical protein
MQGFVEFNLVIGDKKLFLRPDEITGFYEENTYTVVKTINMDFQVSQDIGEVCDRIQIAEMNLPRSDY